MLGVSHVTCLSGALICSLVFKCQGASVFGIRERKLPGEHDTKPDLSETWFLWDICD